MRRKFHVGGIFSRGLREARSGYRMASRAMAMMEEAGALMHDDLNLYLAKAQEAHALSMEAAETMSREGRELSRRLPRPRRRREWMR